MFGIKELKQEIDSIDDKIDTMAIHLLDIFSAIQELNKFDDNLKSLNGLIEGYKEAVAMERKFFEESKKKPGRPKGEKSKG